MPEVKLYGCSECSNVEQYSAESKKERVCDKCLRGRMKSIVVQTGAVSGDVTKFFRVDE